jgi:23S rRNA pseudouridine2605 synthase
VYDLIAGLGEFVVPVGRLDQDSSGLLLMTNDTALAELIMNPENEVPKTYLVKAASLLSEEHLEQLRHGVELDDGPTRPAAVRRLRDSEKHTFVELTIREGRYREVRRMLEAVGSRVLKLVRTSVGPLAIGGLEIGRYRELTPEEVKSLIPRARNRLRAP